MDSPGARLRAIRRQLNLTQADLADRAACSRGNVAAWEVGAKKIGTQTATKLANAMRIPPELLL